MDEALRSSFDDMHRELKQRVHFCQFKAYSDEKKKLKDIESEASLCYLPLLLLNRHASVTI